MAVPKNGMMHSKTSVLTSDAVSTTSLLGYGFQAMQKRLEKTVSEKRLSACEFANNETELSRGFGDSAMYVRSM